MDTSCSALIFDICHSSFVDGPGIRTTVFFKGCNLRCSWCHNPESRTARPELLFFRDKCTGCGRCAEKCPTGGALDKSKCVVCGECAKYCPSGARRVCGVRRSIDEIFAQIEADRCFYDASGGGVTMSGGECLLQPEPLTALLAKCREEGISTAVDTACDVPFDILNRVMPVTDLFLLDIKCMDREKHRRYTGVYNDRILDNIRRLSAAGARCRIRTPFIPGVNDGEEDLCSEADFLLSLCPPESVELLPYHRLGLGKYRAAFGAEPEDFDVPSPETVRRAAAYLRSRGLNAMPL